MDYSEINLDETIQKGLAEAGYVTCTPVQEQVLQASLDGTDLYVQSQTGTGKTAAYLVSIMQELLSKGADERGTALVMVPTRELAVQVEEEALKLGKYTGLRFASFFGGVGYEKQVAALKAGVDVIIGTPGRVIDLQEGRQMDLSHVAFLAIDEADRMFDMGFYPDLRKLIKVLPSSEVRQTMLFSATLNLNVKNLAYEYTKSPKEITIEAQNITVDEINQVLMHVSGEDKNRLLVGIIEREKPESLIIFCNTKKMCEVISKRLRINGIDNEFIIGDLPQKKRQHIMDDFKNGRTRCLIATDVAARGIDVNDLAMVINYDLPNESENYVHRIGRTARAGKSGKAYSFCSDSPEDAFNLMGIESYIEKKIPFVVAAEEDFGEDKSKDMWIRTGDWRDDGRGERSPRGSSRDSSRHPRGERRERDGLKERGERVGRRGRKPRMSDDEAGRMAGLSLEERMKLYKEKYASEQRPVALKGVDSAQAGGSRERRGGKKLGDAPRQVRSGEARGKGAPAPKRQETPKKKPAAQNARPAEKPKGLLHRIRSFFRRSGEKK